MIIDEIMLGLKFRERENNKDRAEMIFYYSMRIINF